MLKKKTLTETVYNNGDPFQIREAISACIGAWQKRKDVQVLWETLEVSTEFSEEVPDSWAYRIAVLAVYDAS